MIRVRLFVFGAGALAVVALLVFPPFMVIDRAAPQTRHSPLGHHPRWSPPTVTAAENVLLEEVGPPPTAGNSSLDIGTNTVLLTIEIVVILLGTTIAWLIFGRGLRTRHVDGSGCPHHRSRPSVHPTA